MVPRWRHPLLVLAALLTVTGTVGCSSAPDAEPVPDPPEVRVLATEVPEAALGTSLAAVQLLNLRCGDVTTNLQGARLTLDAARSVGLEAGDARWASASQTLAGAVATRPQGSTCRAQLRDWLKIGLVPPPFPVQKSPPTTVSTEAIIAELTAQGPVPLVTPVEFEQLRVGQSIEEVRRLLGSSGNLVTESVNAGHRDQIYFWPAKGKLLFNTTTCQFRDGRLVAFTTDGYR